MPETTPICQDRQGSADRCHRPGTERVQVRGATLDLCGLHAGVLVARVPMPTLRADARPAPQASVRVTVFPHGYRADPCGEDAMGREQAQRAMDA